LDVLVVQDLIYLDLSEAVEVEVATLAAVVVVQVERVETMVLVALVLSVGFFLLYVLLALVIGVIGGVVAVAARAAAVPVFVLLGLIVFAVLTAFPVFNQMRESLRLVLLENLVPPHFSEVIFREELENLKNEYLNRLCLVHLFSRENLGNAIQKGRIDEQKCLDLHRAFLQNEQIDDVFICGPEQMILDVKAAMLTKGVAEKNIHFELFHSGASKKTETKNSETQIQVSSIVTVILDDDAIEFPLDSSGMSILDAASNAGTDVPYACKGGVCCTCKARVMKGSVRMDLNYALTPEEVEAGYILTCQAHPTSEEVLVSFDD
jgi:ferredoxin